MLAKEITKTLIEKFEEDVMSKIDINDYNKKMNMYFDILVNPNGIEKKVILERYNISEKIYTEVLEDRELHITKLIEDHKLIQKSKILELVNDETLKATEILHWMIFSFTKSKIYNKKFITILAQLPIKSMDYITNKLGDKFMMEGREELSLIIRRGNESGEFDVTYIDETIDILVSLINGLNVRFFRLIRNKDFNREVITKMLRANIVAMSRIFRIKDEQLFIESVKQEYNILVNDFLDTYIGD